ncbi:MAG TPA: anthranilate synthase component I, partial [Rhodothermales bacterium]
MLTAADFKTIANRERAQGTERFIVPVHRRLSADLLTPVSAFLALRTNSRYPMLLESVEGGEKLGRYSFILKNPYRVVTARDRDVRVEANGRAEELPVRAHGGNGRACSANVFDVLQSHLDSYREVRLPDLPRLTGGAVGFLGYDAVRLLERLPEAPPDELGLPDAIWGFYDTVVAFDHVKHQLILIRNAFIDPETDLDAAYAAAAEGIDALERELREHTFEKPAPISIADRELTSNVTRDRFEEAVTRAKEYIYEGDIFQVVLSQRFSTEFEGDRFNLYRALRQVNPSPYLFYLDFHDFALIGSSPEVLVRVEERRAEVLPIAGTRPRGETPEDDRRLETELLGDPKERAEHLMLVDLGRNDLGRVCDYATVGVSRYAYVERYSHVMHIVSSVSGTMQSGRGAMDVLAACFPAGTVSGAPKVRAMEIINELEPARRNVYAGAVGYVDHSGNMDTCIAIRTMVVRGNRVYVQAGAGIVADSDPAKEFEETVN